jgi:chromosome segregation protein
MRLKRLELFGFKSFADRTQFDFGANTLTGVVGPNGCGKSNVVDSVRWVLGEQRPTSMRGSEMTDVIFKGSVSRPALAVAEVTLILDNSASTLVERGAEVSITRRVFKDGEGEYLLDGQKVRLKDVREMLFDTGLGSRGYAVLEQGKIDAVLSANPLERRRVFEEAAGISRYRQRKVEAELRLKRVADDMARLEDVIGELSTRVRSLKIQAGKAERFVEAQAQWASEKTRLLKHRVWLFDRQALELSSAIGSLESDAQRLRDARQGAESSVQTRQREHAALTAELDRLASETSRRAGDGRAIDERRAQLQSRVASLEAGARDEGQRAETLSRTLRERDLEITALDESIADVARACKAAEATAKEHERRATELDRSYGELRRSTASKNETVLRLLQQATEAENRARHLSESRGPAAEREQRVSDRLAQARAAADAMESEAATQSAALERAQEAQAAQESLRRDLAQRLADNAAGAGDVERRKNALDLERTRVASRIEFLLDRERDLEELSAAARELLSEVDSETGPCAPGELLGLVADQLRTDSQTARALDATLGARAGSLVARDLSIARRVAEWIAAREAGQVGLVLPEGLLAADARETSDDLALDDRARAGLLGRLRDRVRASEGFELLADLLCGNVWIARDLDVAIDLASRIPRASFVTLEGEFVDSAGLCGGHRTLVQGAVGRRASASDLSGELSDLDAKLGLLDGERRELIVQRTSLQKEWERSSQELEARRQARAQAQGALETARARGRDLAAARSSLEQESGAALSESGRIEREMAESRARHAELKANFDRESASLNALVADERKLETQREEALREQSRLEVETSRLSAELSGSMRRREDLARARGEAASELARAERLSGENLATAKSSAAECERLAEESARILTQRAADDEQLEQLRSAVEASRAAIELDRQRAESVTRELEAHGEALGSKRLEAQRVEMLRAELSRRAEEDLALDASAITRDFEPEEALLDAARQDELEAEVRELRSRLDKLGPVNMEAMAELQEVGGRLEFLTTQHKDLAQARESLNEAVRTIDKESKRLFLETFEAVRANFQRIFRQLFGGGKADVTLEEGADVLDAGVEIVARPPGRELLSIGLLSGGQRTLTALALLFAVFEARPSPFCILDEVDAALDDANVERFLAMLDHFRASTQFVVVTHNKGTMAACQSLYGVTMETKGVSRQVAVELSDVDQWAREVTSESGSAPVSGSGATNGAGPSAIDSDSGEPVVELVPASVDAGGHVRGGTARRRRTAEAADESRVADGSAAVE